MRKLRRRGRKEGAHQKACITVARSGARRCLPRKRNTCEKHAFCHAHLRCGTRGLVYTHQRAVTEGSAARNGRPTGLLDDSFTIFKCIARRKPGSHSTKTRCKHCCKQCAQACLAARCAPWQLGAPPSSLTWDQARGAGHCLQIPHATTHVRPRGFQAGTCELRVSSMVSHFKESGHGEAVAKSRLIGHGVVVRQTLEHLNMRQRIQQVYTDAPPT